MTQALVIGASGGIGRALAVALRARGDQVTELSRSANGLDVTQEASVKGTLAELSGPFRTVIVATGALEIEGAEPEKTLRALDASALAAQFALNSIGPMLVLKHINI